MNNYNVIKDTVIIKDDILGNMTLDEVLSIIEMLLEDNIKFEEIVSSILHKNKANDSSIINKLMYLSSTDLIKFYINVIKDKI